jgi:hypothetical protein
MTAVCTRPVQPPCLTPSHFLATVLKLKMTVLELVAIDSKAELAPGQNATASRQPMLVKSVKQIVSTIH